MFGHLDEEIYIEIPEGFENKENANSVCLLKRRYMA